MRMFVVKAQVWVCRRCAVSLDGRGCLPRAWQVGRCSVCWKTDVLVADGSEHGLFVVEPAKEGGYSSFIPGVPGANSQGETAEEAMKNVIEALEELLAYRRDKDTEGRVSKPAVLCPRCNVPLVPGVALMPTGELSPDFIGDDPDTMTVGTHSGMETRLADCLKCPKCGHSVSLVDGGPK